MPTPAAPPTQAQLAAGATALLVLTMTIQVMAWRDPISLIGILALPLVMTALPWRWWPALVALVYFGTAAAELPAIIARFYSGPQDAPVSEMTRYGAPVALAAIQSLPFLLLDPTQPPARRFRRLLGAFALSTLPPIGLVTWANPLLLAGLAFPGLGLIGLVACAVLLAGAGSGGLARDTRSRPIVAAVLATLILAVWSNWTMTRNPPPMLDGWVAMNTAIEPQSLRDPLEIRELVPGAIVAYRVRELLPGGAQVLVFPESIIAPRTPADELTLAIMQDEAARAEAVVLVGETIPGRDGRWRNVVRAYGPQAGAIVDEARLPMPMGNWRWRGGVRARPFQSDLVTLPTRTGPLRVAMSICYEDTVVWGHWGLLTGQADAMISLANTWATQDTRGDRTQAVSAAMLARLGGVALTRATNRWPEGGK